MSAETIAATGSLTDRQLMPRKPSCNWAAKNGRFVPRLARRQPTLCRRSAFEFRRSSAVRPLLRRFPTSVGRPVVFQEEQVTPTLVIPRSLIALVEVAGIAVIPCFELARLKRLYIQGFESDREADASSRSAWSKVSFNAPALPLIPRKHSALPKAKQA